MSSTPPSLVCRQLSVKTQQGTAVGPLDWELPAGTHGAVLGQQGSGRSTLLLALGGRMKGVTGSLAVGDLDGIAHPRALRARTTIARISGLAELEPALTVGESRDEAAILQGVGARKGRRAFSELQEATGVRFDSDRLVGDLTAVQRTLLTALLGCLRESDIVLLDEVDDALTRDQLDEVYRVLELLGRRGHRFVVSALETTPPPPGATTLVLEPREETH